MPLAAGARLGPYEILAHRRGRDGRGLPRARHAARPHRRHQGPSRRTSRLAPSCASASSARRGPSPPSTIRTSASLHDVGRAGRDRLPGHGVPGGRDAGRPAEAGRRSPSSRRCATGSRSPRRSTSAHRQGIVHRDLKPGNVMLTKVGGEAARLRPGQAAAAPDAAGSASALERAADERQAADRGGQHRRHVPVHGARAARRARRRTRARTSSRSARCSTRW